MNETRITAILVAALFLLCACGAAGDNEEQRKEAFDQVWSHLEQNFYDDTFGGKDWHALAAIYRPRALEAPTDEAFYGELNGMLFELGVSHIAVIPDEHPEWIGAPSAFANGEVGLDIRLVDGQFIVVTRDARLGDQEPGLMPGTIIKALNGSTVDDFLAEVREPPVSAIPELMAVTERAARELFADPGTIVQITYIDDDNTEQSTSLVAFERGSAITLLEGVPPVYVDFESRLLDENVGYIQFNSFHPALLDQIVDAMERFDDCPALILDLRGNVGGDFNVRRTIAERLIRERSVVWRYRGRRGTDNVVLEPHDNAYDGKVAFLVDELSASSAEELSGAMQALGRAFVVGNRTAGVVLVADTLRLEIGATLVFPIAETSFVNGYVPEGKGVIPDEPVPWDRASLLDDRDLQLETALKLLSGE